MIFIIALVFTFIIKLRFPKEVFIATIMYMHITSMMCIAADIIFYMGGELGCIPSNYSCDALWAIK